MRAFDNTLTQLLNRDVAEVRAWERAAFEQLAGDRAGRIVLFGAGNLGRKAARGLARAGVTPLAFADNNSAIWGQTVAGLPVLSPEEAAARHGQDAAFVVTIWSAGSTSRFAATRAQLHRLGCSCVLPLGPLFWRHAAHLLPHYALDLPHNVVAERDAVREAATLWSDDRSRDEYRAQIRWRLEHDFDVLPPRAEETEYFPEDLPDLGPFDHYVDCGAYDGDTVGRFLSRRTPFSRITAFEPDPDNFAKLQAFVSGRPAADRDRIVCHRAAVSDAEGTLEFFSDGMPDASLNALARQDRRTVSVAAMRVDDALQDGPPATYIKLDVEGAEAQALRGAAGTIARHRPSLAVCVYHRQVDIWQLPLQLRAMCDGYRFFLRAHSEGVFDLVCYAIPA
ncbi:MAG: FkbM family methyltransferase [Deltaproteobacteria bacterium]|nr:FkbM family methyltransferase [Deltaproteobacteria bacterium]